MKKGKKLKTLKEDKRRTVKQYGGQEKAVRRIKAEYEEWESE